MAKVSAKSKAVDNTTARKLEEAKSIIGNRYDKIALLDSNGKASKATVSWMDIFSQAGGDAQEAHKQYKEAQEVYSKESESISQLFLSLCRVSATLDQFNADYKAMRNIYKSVKGDIPQSIYDAAGIVRKAWNNSIDPTKAKSIHELKVGIKAQVKLDKDDTTRESVASLAVVDDLGVVLKDLAMVGNTLYKSDKGAFTAFMAALQSVGKEFLPVVKMVVPDNIDEQLAHELAATATTDNGPRLVKNATS